MLAPFVVAHSAQVIWRNASIGNGTVYSALLVAGAWEAQHRQMVKGHMTELATYSHKQSWPLLSAVVVSKPNLKSCDLDAGALDSFFMDAINLGFRPKLGKYEFWQREKDRVFQWARRKDTQALFC